MTKKEEEIEMETKEAKKAFVPCTFHCKNRKEIMCWGRGETSKKSELMHACKNLDSSLLYSQVFLN